MKMVKLTLMYRFYVSLYLFTTLGVSCLEYNVTRYTKEQDVTIPVGTMVSLNCKDERLPVDRRLVWYKTSNVGNEQFDFKEGFCVLNISQNKPMAMERQKCQDKKIGLIFTSIQFRDAGSWLCRSDAWDSKSIRINITSNDAIDLLTNETPTSSVPSAVWVGVGVGVGVAGWILEVGTVAFLVYRKKSEDTESLPARNLSDDRQTSVHEYNYIDDQAIRPPLGLPPTNRAPSGGTARQGRGGNVRPLYSPDGYLTPNAGSRGVDVNGVTSGGTPCQVSRPEGYTIPYSNVGGGSMRQVSKPIGYSNLNSDTHGYEQLYGVIGGVTKRQVSNP